MMNRRNFVTAATVAPASAFVSQIISPVQNLYADWLALTEQFKEVDRRWSKGLVSDGDYEALTNPILDKRNQVEDRLFEAPAESVGDIRVKAEIAKYFGWTVDQFCEAVLADLRTLTA